LSQRVDILPQNQEGSTCLALAAAKGHSASVQAILDENKSLCATKDGLGRTPLALAAAGGHTESVSLLCRADRRQVNDMDNQGLSPFFKATAGGHVEAMKILLDYGATRESLAQSSTRVRDLNAHHGAMRALRHTTPEGEDYVFSKALNRRYRML
jgi:ankyrin repeat protein